MEIKKLQNDYRKIVANMGSFSILESSRDESVSPWNATSEYFMEKMGVRRRQLIATLNGNTTVITQAGAMQWSLGNISSNTGLKVLETF